MHKPCHQDRQAAPRKRRSKADLPLKIKGLIRIIPVAHLKQRLHRHAGHILQNRRADTARHKGQQQIIPKRAWNHEHHHAPGPIKRQEGAVDKPSVYQPFLFQRNICRFKAPSEKAVKEKEKRPLNPCISQHKSSSHLLFSRLLTQTHRPLLQAFLFLSYAFRPGK